MNLRRLVTAVLFLTVGLARASAHNVAPEPVVDVFVRPAGDHLTTELRLPVAVLADANLPRNADGRFAQGEIAQALELVARGIARDLQFQQGDDLLATPAISASLSSDDAFAVVSLDYLIRPDRAGLSARLHSFRAGGQVVRTDVHYVVDPRTTRTFSIAGDSERVTFEPVPVEVVRRFLRGGTDLVLTAGDYLLFALCLIAPVRRPGALVRGCAALLAGEALAVVVSGLGWLPLAPDALLAVQAAAASAIVIAALQDLVSPGSRWLWPLALIFGLAEGLSVGERFASETAFAGSHVALGLFSWLSAVELGQIWVVALLASAAGLLRRRGMPAQLAVLALSIFAGHASLHRLVDRAQLLAERGSVTLDHFLLILALSWACLILCAGILETLFFGGANPSTTRASLSDARSAEPS